MTDTKILKHLLNYTFYTANKTKLSPTLFEDEVRELYEVIESAHETYSKNLSGHDLLALWKVDNPVAVRAKIAVIEDLVGTIEHETPYAEGVADTVINHLWQREHGRQIAQAGLAISEGKPGALQALQKLLDATKDGFLPDDWGLPTTQDLHELLELTGDEHRFRFNILSLSSKVYGIGPGEFGAVFARPESGKTTFGVSIACAPGGFCEQGARVFIGGNEEDTRRTMLRAYQSASGMTREEIVFDPHRATEAFKRIKDNLVIRDVMSWSIYDLDAYLEKEQFDVVIIDQLDKIKIPEGHDMAGHDKLRQIYLQSREIAKKRKCAFIGMSQASVDAEGKTILDYSMMEGSKTGKAAETDLLIGIGKYPDSEDGDNPDVMRFLNICKNKLNGYHGCIPCKIEPQLGRYID